MSRTLLVLGGILAAGAAIAVGSQLLPAPSAAPVNALQDPIAPVPLSVSVGDEIPEGAVLPPGLGRDCPAATPGWCVVTERSLDYSDGGLRAAREAAQAERAQRAVAGGTTWFDAMALAQIRMEGLMREPRSARYRNAWRVRFGDGRSSMWAFCGEVLGENGFGGRSGFARFVATTVLAAVEGQPGFERLYREVCVDLPGHGSVSF